MKTILVPTDFSKNANHALDYAIELNKAFQGKIVLFHTVMVPYYATEVPIAVPTNESLLNEAVSELSEIKERICHANPGMNFSMDASIGITSDEITDAEKSYKTEYVIMGTRGGNGLREFIIGSDAVRVVEKSLCPVITVPEKAKLNPPAKMVFATNYGEDDFENILSAIEFVKMFNAEIHLLHISEEKADKIFESGKMKTFASSLKSESKYSKIFFSNIFEDDVYEGLNNFIQQINADILAISMRENRLKLFSRSLTTKMVYYTHVPVMVFHTRN